jgi:hypothetical protein
LGETYPLAHPNLGLGDFGSKISYIDALGKPNLGFGFWDLVLVLIFGKKLHLPKMKIN